MVSHHKVSLSPSAGMQQHPQHPQHRQHHIKARGRRSWAPSATPGLLLLLVVLLLSCLTVVDGASIPALHAHGGRRARSAPLPDSLGVDSVPAITAWSLIIDTSTPPSAPLLMPPALHGDATKTTDAPPSKRSGGSSPTASDEAFEIPRPFDTALSNNFTNNCATFFKTMLTSPTLNDCHPFSLLLQTSNSLFQASKSYVRITQTLEATCAANSTQCAAGLGDMARRLLAEDACKVDYDNNNPQVVQAYNGLVAYEPLYQASCLRDDDGKYCKSPLQPPFQPSTNSGPRLRECSHQHYVSGRRCLPLLPAPRRQHTWRRPSYV